MTAPPITRTDVSLTAARGDGDQLAHLVAPLGARGLCGRLIRVRPAQTSLRDAGCPECLALAVAGGHVAARDGDGSRADLLERCLTTA